MHRWSIETSYKYFKSNLGFNEYRVQSSISIERYFLIVFLAYNFLELFRVTEKHEALNTIGKAQEHLNSLTTKALVRFIYEKSKQNATLRDMERDYFMSAEEAMSYGIIDKILLK
ncbi:ATP-dependent Clp protease proteolytic subunit [Clostridium sp. DJ247]|uniref:ATP-dependent Clp protease proteolytic subunit n=1 Tax=Clostridium sp. DJ247 TaxID=2726188 RepID=UPI0016268FD8|nr:ATP-dependent Clp protease proteolytic subunit [Clostridium sp. DJ247]MBC2578774.1 hypothetical protein [Clostridium sp. DJ247]